MPLTCSAALFFYEWKACWEDETRKTDKLYWMVKPFLDRWALHLRNPEQGYEVNFVSMMSLLQSNGDPYELVHNWVRVQDANTSVEDTLVLLFFERLRNYRFIPKNIQGVYAEYCIARDFKLFLRNQIRDCWTATRPRYIPPSPLAYEDEHPDWLMIETLNTDAWNSYLADYIVEGRTRELLNVTGWTNEELTKEVTKLCLLVKKQQLDS